MNELVSVIMPMHNAEPYVSSAIQSCLAQTYRDWELIVVDDASQDNSVEVVESFDDPRVRLVRFSTNAGAGPARNAALETARGEWVTVLDADDLYCRSRLGTMMDAAHREGRDCLLIDKMRRWELTTPPPDHFLEGRELEGEPRTRSLPEWVATSHAGKPFFHASAIEDERVRYPSTRGGNEDTAFFIRLAEHRQLRIVEIPDETYIYRRTPGSLIVRTPERLDERQRTLELLAQEFSTSSELLEAIKESLGDNRRERQVLDLRRAVASSNPVEAAKVALSSPEVVLELFRRLPYWLRSRAEIRKRRRAQSQ